MSSMEIANQTAADVVAAPATRGLRWPGLLLGVIVSPRKTFRDLDRKPDWIWPVVLSIVFSVGSDLAIRTYLDRDEEKLARQKIEQKYEKRGIAISDISAQERQQIDREIQMASRLQRFTPVILVFYVAIVMLSFALLYWSGTILVEGMLSFLKVFSVTGYAFCVAFTGLPALLKTAAAFLWRPDEPDILRAVTAPSLALLMPTNAPRLLVEVLSRADLFTIWFLILAAIGLATICRKAKLRWTASVVFGLWAISVAIRIAWVMLVRF